MLEKTLKKEEEREKEETNKEEKEEVENISSGLNYGQFASRRGLKRNERKKEVIRFCRQKNGHSTIFEKDFFFFRFRE